MAIPANTRFQYVGGAQPSTLATHVGINDTTIQIASGFGWPTGVLPAAALINGGAPNAEVVYFTPRDGQTLRNCERGADGSPASAHEAGEKIELCMTARDLDEANALVTQANVWNSWVPAFFEHPGYPTDQRATPTSSLIYATYNLVGKNCTIEVSANVSLRNGVGPEFLMSLPFAPARTGEAGSLQFQNKAGHLVRWGPEEQELGGFLAGKASVLKYDHTTWLSDSLSYRLNIRGGYAVA